MENADEEEPAEHLLTYSGASGGVFLSFLWTRLTTCVFACVPMNGHAHSVITYSG